MDHDGKRENWAAAAADADAVDKKENAGDHVDEAMKKCMEENKGDITKCKSLVEAFKTPPRRPVAPLLRSGSLTDV